MAGRGSFYDEASVESLRDVTGLFKGFFTRDIQGFADEQSFRTSTNDWGAMASAFRIANTEHPQFLTNWLRNVGKRMIDEIRKVAEAPGRSFTGTYADSLSWIVYRTGEEDIELALGHLEPIGDAADRLHIYWKVIEVGARPNPKLSGMRSGRGLGGSRPGSLFEWSLARTSPPRPDLGIALAHRNRAGLQGIEAHPILGKFFILSGPNLTVSGLTPKGRDIVNDVRAEQWRKYESSVIDSIPRLTTEARFRRRGREVRQMREVLTGRFTTVGG